MIAIYFGLLLLASKITGVARRDDEKDKVEQHVIIRVMSERE